MWHTKGPRFSVYLKVPKFHSCKQKNDRKMLLINRYILEKVSG